MYTHSPHLVKSPSTSIFSEPHYSGCTFSIKPERELFATPSAGHKVAIVIYFFQSDYSLEKLSISIFHISYVLVVRI